LRSDILPFWGGVAGKEWLFSVREGQKGGKRVGKKGSLFTSSGGTDSTDAKPIDQTKGSWVLVPGERHLNSRLQGEIKKKITRNGDQKRGGKGCRELFCKG